MSNDLSKTKKVFFIGIGGIGISALAKMCLSRGMEVSGVNDEESLKTLEPLRELGAKIFLSADSSTKSLAKADLYVYSDAWIYRGPELIEEARKTGKPTLSYFEALGEFAKDYKVIAVSGTHGKTTTTAMVAEIMIDAGLDPTVVIGSFVKKFGSNFRAGKSDYLLVEADEYNRHFLNFHPFISVVTNIEADHLDYYKNLEDIEEAFDKFIQMSEHHVIDYRRYLNLVPTLLVPGEHNRQNAAAALAVADKLGIDSEVARTALEGFEGTWRRLEKRGVTEGGTIIYDDYAHHPTEVRASLSALRELYPGNKIVVVFQPHLYSRTKALFADFATCFRGADQVLLLPIYFARESSDGSVSVEDLALKVSEASGSGIKAESCTDFTEAEAKVRALGLTRGDIFVTMGAGEAYQVADKVFSFS